MMSFDSSWLHQTERILDDPNEKLQEYILNQHLQIHDPAPYILPRQSNPSNLYYAPNGTASTTLVADRDPVTGQILEFIESNLNDTECTAKNSMSMQRAPVRPEQATRGSATNFPFWPGGFDEPVQQIELLKLDNSVFERNLLTKAPGFSHGLEFEANKMGTDDGSADVDNDANESVDLLSIVEDEHSILGMWSDNEPTKKSTTSNQFVYDEELDEVILKTPAAAPIIEISKTRKPKVKSMEYAEWVDVTQPVKDFEQQVPELAHQYPFTLDTFQKQAIIKLENHNHIFVSAHTSAGKTVVAEYAIALSQKHMTRTIYTSPIKALSNQKYRDFKKTFNDVGIITGDIQINPSAACLIMTTEILRSMLYCGSDVTRDLEYVIFDEVHYITDMERGVVWEEVLILLPEHVHIIMLSATVPNALTFSNWVGMTKRKKVYVISTLKRPVPLKHYLYTGHNAETKKELFLIVDADGHFLTNSYANAKEAKLKQHQKHDKAKGRGGPRGGGSGGGGGGRGGGGGGGGGRSYGGPMNPKHESQIWSTLIDHLRQNEQLPMIAFTLSRKKCDEYVQNLNSLNLTTSAEASEIRFFFNKCLSKLKPEDRVIPQVKMLQESLVRGIGVHHSGILPILKEVVELLFQRNFVKLLFATETFAMGVNMPARTVVFDSYKKHDGKELRAILPAEYTQMAGRAGRRGLDEYGTVILLCKMDVPPDTELKKMITGQPKNLESKFRLTYKMILNLFRVEGRVSVEDMMSHSFKEFETQSAKPETEAELKKFEQEMMKIPDLGSHMEPLRKFFDAAYDYILTQQRCMSRLATNKYFNFKPGRIIYISHNKYQNRFALFLSAKSVGGKDQYEVLILDNDATNDDVDSTAESVNRLVLDGKSGKSADSAKAANRGELWYRMIGLTKPSIYKLNAAPGHKVLTITPSDIIDITTTTNKIDAVAILNNWSQRQRPRFRDTPIGPSTEKAINELINFHKTLKPDKLKSIFVNFKQEFKMIQDFDLLGLHRKTMEETLPYTKIANFEQEFAPVFDRRQLEAIQRELRFKMSHESLTLYPEYQYKTEILKRLNYVDDQQGVTLKGRVACEMGSNELMITELVLCNTFNDKSPAEIAALLSSLVFQGKTQMEQDLSDNLIECVETIQAVDRTLREVEDEVMKDADKEVRETAQLLDFERLNFGLVRVVYEWARAKPFAEIMKFTDIQEGVIVRCIQQLNETLQDVKNAARIIGNPALHQKMEEASNAIKRDIVFAASLYFQD